MKKSLITFAFAVSLSLLFVSCKKDATQSSTSTYYIQGKKDGVAFNFTSNTQAAIFTSGNITLVSLLADLGTNQAGFNLGITFSNGTFNTGIYSENNSSSGYTVGGVYSPGNTTMVNGAGIQNSVQPLVINVLTKTSTEVTGTFSGAFYREDATTATFYPDYILVTEGTFKLPIK